MKPRISAFEILSFFPASKKSVAMEDEHTAPFTFSANSPSVRTYSGICSPSLTITSTRPSAPMRPVRPLRCVHASEVEGTKADILGFICQQGALDAGLVGKIDLRDRFAYVAVPKEAMRKLLENLEGKKIKGKKIRISEAK